jgi:hypothetical protein
MFFALLIGPEVVAVTVVAESWSARRSVSEFKAAGFDGWMLQHAFFANMGGFVLQTPDWMPFPIDAKQLLWLIKHGYIRKPLTDPTLIKDKNKIDVITRFIMAVQTIWFLVNLLGRLINGYAITAIELTTVGTIYCTLPIMFQWRHKPASVAKPEVLQTDKRMRDILLNAGDEARLPYLNTPLDFVSRKEWPFSVYWSHFAHALAKFHFKSGSQPRPVSRISNTHTPEVPLWLFRCGVVAGLGFAAISVLGWNFSFPTTTEQLLWRAASLTCLISLLAGELVTEIFFHVLPYWKRNSMMIRKIFQSPGTGFPGNHEIQDLSQAVVAARANGTEVIQPSRSQPKTLWAWLRNPTASQDPELFLPLKIVLLLIFLVSSYIFARLFILIEDFIELRSLPSSAYKTVEWADFIPSFT